MTFRMDKPLVKLLHAEDDQLAADMFQALLMHELGDDWCEITNVDSIADTRKILRTEDFDVIILDLGLRDIQGMQNLATVREIATETPIVVLSARDELAVAMDAIRNGAQDYVIKSQHSGRQLALAVLSSIERKAYEQRLFKQANTDELTQLANRRFFMDYIERRLPHGRRWRHTQAVMFMDLNNFKIVNDTLGHDVGDEVLVEAARRISENLRKSDTLARFGGDEFVLHLESADGESVEGCRIVAKKIAEALHKPITVGDHVIETGISIGIALFPENARDSAELITAADSAMYEAKKSKTDYAFAKTVTHINAPPKIANG